MGVTSDKLALPDEATIKSVLGKSHGTVAGQYTAEQQSYFDMYHALFKLGSKPTAHIDALAILDDEALAEKMPPVLARMFKVIEEKLKGLPE
jgi:putative ATP-dependent endonuclease of OLD family